MKLKLGLVFEMVSRKAALTFWKFAIRSRTGWFGSLLGLLPEELGGNLRIERIEKDHSVVSTVVPDWCVDKNGRLLLSAGVAMFDEISTYCGTMQWDRNCRPGVSIQLVGSALRPLDVGAGDRVVVETYLQKVGKTLGFVNIHIKDMDGNLLVEGNHIKFMPMGAYFDVLFNPLIREGVTIPIWDRVLSSQSIHSFSMPKTQDELFQFPEDNTNQFPVNPNVGNPIGNLHGGASVMLSTAHAQRTIREESNKANDVLVPTSIKTNLLSGISTTKNISISLQSTLHECRNQGAKSTMGIRSKTLLFDKTPNVPCYDSEIYWE